MKFLPTVNLWDAATAAALRSGQLKLQRGQWCQCGEGARSRFVGIYAGGRSIWVAHPEGKHGTRDSFKRLCSVA
jgi:hypothetical protein